MDRDAKYRDRKAKRTGRDMDKRCWDTKSRNAGTMDKDRKKDLRSEGQKYIRERDI